VCVVVIVIIPRFNQQKNRINSTTLLNYDTKLILKKKGRIIKKRKEKEKEKEKKKKAYLMLCLCINIILNSR